MDKISPLLKTVDMLEEDFGETANVKQIEVNIRVPDDIEDIFNSDLVHLYHAKAKVFEVNAVPIQEDKIAQISKRVSHVRKLSSKLSNESNSLFSIFSTKRITRAFTSNDEAAEAENGSGANGNGITSLDQLHNEVLGLLSEEPIFKGQYLNSKDLKSGIFEEDPEAYIDYSKLTVQTNLDKLLNDKSNTILLLSKSKLNPHLKCFAVRHWSEILRNHFMTANFESGIKVPHRASKGFIVRVVIYLQTLVEEKDLQTENNFELMGIEPSLFRLIYLLDMDCLLNNVAINLSELRYEKTSSRYFFTVLVVYPSPRYSRIIVCSLRGPLPGQISILGTFYIVCIVDFH